jgi:hypothetical protein
MRSTYWPLRGGEIDREMVFLYEVEKKWVEEGACGDVWFKMYMKYGPTTTIVRLGKTAMGADSGGRIAGVGRAGPAACTSATTERSP